MNFRLGRQLIRCRARFLMVRFSDRTAARQIPVPSVCCGSVSIIATTIMLLSLPGCAKTDSGSNDLQTAAPEKNPAAVIESTDKPQPENPETKTAAAAQKEETQKPTDKQSTNDATANQNNVSAEEDPRLMKTNTLQFSPLAQSQSNR